MKIHWLPYRRQSFYTRLSADEAMQALSDQVVRKRVRWWGPGGDFGKFEGEVSARGFKINRVPTYRGWYPTVIGVFKPLDTGTRIDVVMRSPWLTIGFLILCFVPLISLAVETIKTGEFFEFITLHEGWFVLPIGASLAVLFWLFSIHLFDDEMNRAREFLRAVFQAADTPMM